MSSLGVWTHDLLLSAKGRERKVVVAHQIPCMVATDFWLDRVALFLFYHLTLTPDRVCSSDWPCNCFTCSPALPDLSLWRRQKQDKSFVGMNLTTAGLLSSMSAIDAKYIWHDVSFCRLQMEFEFVMLWCWWQKMELRWRKRKSQHPTGVKLTTYELCSVCSTAVLHNCSIYGDFTSSIVEAILPCKDLVSL